MKITPVRSVKDYDGPRDYKRIILRIIKDAHDENNVELPFYYVEKMVAQFFSYQGINYYFRNFQTFSIPGLGRFVLNGAGCKARKRKARMAIAARKKTNRIYFKKHNKILKRLKRIAKREALKAKK